MAPTSEKEIRSNIGKKYIESMVVADKSVVDFHGKESVSRYVLALLSVVRIRRLYISADMRAITFYVFSSGRYTTTYQNHTIAQRFSQTF